MDGNITLLTAELITKRVVVNVLRNAFPRSRNSISPLPIDPFSAIDCLDGNPFAAFPRFAGDPLRAVPRLIADRVAHALTAPVDRLGTADGFLGDGLGGSFHLLHHRFLAARRKRQNANNTNGK